MRAKNGQVKIPGVCVRCNNKTNRNMHADYCWSCMRIVEREKAHLRKAKKEEESNASVS